MIADYIGSINNEHHVTKYTLSTAKVVALAKEEPGEFKWKFINILWVKSHQEGNI